MLHFKFGHSGSHNTHHPKAKHVLAFLQHNLDGGKRHLVANCDSAKKHTVIILTMFLWVSPTSVTVLSCVCCGFPIEVWPHYSLFPAVAASSFPISSLTRRRACSTRPGPSLHCVGSVHKTCCRLPGEPSLSARHKTASSDMRVAVAAAQRCASRTQRSVGRGGEWRFTAETGVAPRCPVGARRLFLCGVSLILS